jgi:hypothetical protein
MTADKKALRLPIDSLSPTLPRERGKGERGAAPRAVGGGQGESASGVGASMSAPAANDTSPGRPRAMMWMARPFSHCPAVHWVAVHLGEVAPDLARRWLAIREFPLVVGAAECAALFRPTGVCPGLGAWAGSGALAVARETPSCPFRLSAMSSRRARSRPALWRRISVRRASPEQALARRAPSRPASSRPGKKFGSAAPPRAQFCTAFRTDFGRSKTHSCLRYPQRLGAEFFFDFSGAVSHRPVLAAERRLISFFLRKARRLRRRASAHRRNPAP